MSGKDAALPPVQSQKNWKNRLAMLAGSVAIVGAAVAVRGVWGPPPAGADAPKGKGKAPAQIAPPVAAAGMLPGEQKMRIMAVVNYQQITRDDLGRECLLHHGKDVLESLTNKHLIAEHCKRRNIIITTKEIDQEIDRMAERFGYGTQTDQWLALLKEQRGISPAQYAKDIIWPTLALRKLAEARLQVTPQDLQQEYETLYGAAVQVRVISTTDPNKAEALRKKVLANPDSFGNVAKEESEDAGSASAKGLIQPVRKHLGDPTIERVAFAMKEGEISEVVHVQNQYVVIKCDSHIAARPVEMEKVQKLMTEAIRDKKLRLAAKDVFAELQRDTVVENIYNDPQKRAANPGVAAMINGHPITLQELTEECIERHGADSLQGLINHRLVEQACQKRKIQIAQQDMDGEVLRAASLGVKALPNGKPDLDAWHQYIIEQQDMTWEVYLHEVIWPEVALKKLVSSKVQISEEDLQKGFEANYGPRVRVRAIVLNQQRRAQEVWEKARKFPAIEKLAKRPAETKGGVWKDPNPEVQALINDAAKQFGLLAAQNSIEAASSALEGEVPPIQRFGGRPQLEQEAFSLRAGELSGIVQLGDKFIIMFCEGHTKPENIKFAEVRDLIAEDLRDKKLHVAMGEEFSKIQEAAQIDNYLAGTTQSSNEERKFFQRINPVNHEGEVDPAVPKGSHSGPAPARLPQGMSPTAAPTTPRLR